MPYHSVLTPYRPISTHSNLILLTIALYCPISPHIDHILPHIKHLLPNSDPTSPHINPISTPYCPIMTMPYQTHRNPLLTCIDHIWLHITHTDHISLIMRTVSTSNHTTSLQIELPSKLALALVVTMPRGWTDTQGANKVGREEHQMCGKDPSTTPSSSQITP